MDAAALEFAWALLDAEVSFPTESIAVYAVERVSEGELVVSVESLMLDDVLPDVEEKDVLEFADACLGCAFSRLALLGAQPVPATVPVRFPDGELIPSRAMLISGELEAVAVVEVVGRRAPEVCVECGDSLAALQPARAGAVEPMAELLPVSV